MIVTLSPNECFFAGTVGLRRRVASMAQGLRDRSFNGTRDPAQFLRMDISGACGENAAAKALGLYWPASVNQPKGEPDLPPVYQVRWTPLATGCLIYRERDRADQKYILVTGDMPTFNVVGWIAGEHCTRPEWEQTPDERGRSWFVPQSALHTVAAT